ncbi:ATP-binding cassette domain-containing protein [Pseudarthrobacter sp. AG30]|uniref:sugar ABC transporter ATP-binding protein n=1 Tax=Pseudarthrobacter sp. AG30 TaxID=2249742 RepID=UPI000D641D45|nr:sugar ABC transporter ATP-binding protein [Pseudarthrobacter sp. AG30]RAX16351.1 ATP-binding cassette domain-containing protein [Pseudarthrobacter sp. AG30]
MSTTTQPALRIDGVSKRFGTTLALDDVSLIIDRGEVRALLGRNGAGKSTLISMITGLLTPDGGTIGFPGSVDAGGVQDNVACVYQHSTLVPDLTAAENISLGTYPTTKAGLVNWQAMRLKATRLLEEWGIGEITDMPVAELDPLHRKIVEICRAVSSGARILLLDEPTAGLDGDATRTLFERLGEMRDRGITVVYVSHYLEEIFEVCDSVTVLRDGRVVHTRNLEGLTVRDIVEAMVGGAVDAAAETSGTPVDPSTLGAQPILTVTGLEIGDIVKDFNVSIRPGECVGLVGLDGSGIFQVADALAGLLPATSGTVEVAGRSVSTGNVGKAINSGIGYLPGDRHDAGFIPEMANEENATLTILGRLRNSLRLINGGQRRNVYGDLAKKWEIKARSGSQATIELSGGNQQKVALARTFASDPKVLILVNPTAGVDVAAKGSIVASVTNAVRGNDRAGLIVSSDESEFSGCSRLLVMFRGRLVGELTAPWTESDLAAAVQGDVALA